MAQEKLDQPQIATGQQQPQVVIINRPPVVQQNRSGGGLFGSLERALNQAGNEIGKAVDGVTHLTIADRLKPGNFIQLQSKINNKSLRVLETGLMDCKGDGGTSCHFKVSPGSTGTNSIKLMNVAQPNKYIAIINEYLVGYGQGGTDCDLVPYVTVDGQYVMLESAIQPGAHIGALQSGDITSPPLTNKSTDAAHFRVLYVGKHGV